VGGLAERDRIARLVELAPLVKQAFEQKFIDPETMDFGDFETQLRDALDGRPPFTWYGEREFELFGDTVEELSKPARPDAEVDPDEDLDEEVDTWEARERRERFSDERVLWGPSEGPAVNPYKGVGRNDPCPCGSGKKFKKCCLGKADALAEPEARARLESNAVLKDVFSHAPDLGYDETTYDPLVAPDPDEWLALEEKERIEMVMDFHRRARIRLPNAKAHAIAHAIVENQIAEGDALPVKRTLERLMLEDLDRHDAVHAIGMVLMCHINNLLKAGHVEGDPNAPYIAELERLTAEQWRRSG
jgi:hypothetical protein